jgi:hypothetical protein
MTIRLWKLGARWFASSGGREAVGATDHEALGRLLLNWDCARVRPHRSAEDALLDIAQKVLDRDTLAPTGNVACDIREVPIWRLRAALEAAYLAGRRAAEAGGTASPGIPESRTPYVRSAKDMPRLPA